MTITEITKKAKLGMTFLELCVVADAGKVFCESCYMVEGDSCLILREENIFQRIKKTIENGYFPYP